MSGYLLRANTGELVGRGHEESEMAGLANAGPACLADSDPALAKAKTLLEQLEQTAKGHGYQSFREMQRRLVEDREDLNSEGRYQLLKRIAPTLHEVEGYASKRTLPEIDATGLLAIQDIAKSVSRLIRVLLLGYTLEEREELADRMKAERAVEVNSAIAQSGAETKHEAALTRIAATAEASSLAERFLKLFPIGAAR